MPHADTHEDFSRHDEIRTSSNASFGFVMAAFFALVGLWPLVKGLRPRWWAVALSALFLLVALTRPALLSVLNRLWTSLARVLNRLISPIVTAALFYLLFTPCAILLRALGKNLLRLGFDSQAGSYWIDRQPPGPPSESMARQF